MKYYLVENKIVVIERIIVCANSPEEAQEKAFDNQGTTLYSAFDDALDDITVNPLSKEDSLKLVKESVGVFKACANSNRQYLNDQKGV